VPVKLDKLGPGRHADGKGLYLDKDGTGRSRWIFMFTRGGKRHEMGLGRGGKGGVSLKVAREEAQKARNVLATGGDPIQARDEARAAQLVIPTFGEAVDTYIASRASSFRNAKHLAQWKTTLKVDAKALADIRVDKVTTNDVLQVLEPIWTVKPETASRLRGRIERVLDSAKAAGHRRGENPAQWRGHLEHMLAPRKKLTRGHHARISHEEIFEFVAGLRSRTAVAARALEFTILTAARTGETTGATWDEIDLEAKVWTVPGERMKAGREHRVPLPDRCV